MTEPLASPDPDFEALCESYFDRIKQIDRILKLPIETFLNAPHLHRKGSAAANKGLVYPPWIVEAAEWRPNAAPEPDVDTQSLCYLTFQRLRNSQRRLSWLTRESRERLRVDGPQLLDRVSPGRDDGLQPDKSTSFHGRLKSRTYGDLNPVTGSQVFKLRMQEGNGQAHCGLGLLSFFAMLWPLYRTYPDQSRGARVEPGDPTAYITAKCVIPLMTLQDLSHRRKKLLGAIATLVEWFGRFTTPRQQTAFDRWEFIAHVEELRDNLHSMQEVAISQFAFEKGEAAVAGLLEELDFGDDLVLTTKQLVAILNQVLIDVSERSREILKDSTSVLNWMKTNILGRLSDPAVDLSELGIEPHPNLDRNGSERAPYLRDLRSAGEEAYALCSLMILVLEKGRRIGRVSEEVVEAPQLTLIVKGFRSLAKGNGRLEEAFDHPIRLSARWCKTVLDREVAFASARNISDFDPAELVSGMVVVVRRDLMTSPLQVRDAVRRSLDGTWSDGSWRLGRPFFRREALASWPPTADVLATLASTIKMQPMVHDADAALFSYVDWLERTQRMLRLEDGEQASGWSADRTRESGRIHLPTTALAINVLLKVRALVEHRLWELCQKRFTVSTENKRLRDVFPVDLNQVHRERLHAALARFAKADRSGKEGGVYSIVLHGPPGSSKTAISQALSQQMWHHARRWGGREARLIRVTPADFTRRGESRLDSEARLIFDLLRHVRGVTILFDEIDDLLLRRESGGGRRFMDLIVPAMLNRLQDLHSVCLHQEICFVLGTNFVENIEPALMRKGRIDKRYAIVYPDWNARLATIGMHFDEKLLKHDGESLSPDEWDSRRAWAIEQVQHLAKSTAGWPWLVLNALCEALGEILRKAPLDVDSREKLDEKFTSMYEIERASLIEPAYIGRLLHRFDSPDLRMEYIQHLLSKAHEHLPVKDLIRAATTEATQYIEAHYPESDHERQNYIWKNRIVPDLKKTASTLLNRRSHHLVVDETWFSPPLDNLAP